MRAVLLFIVLRIKDLINFGVSLALTWIVLDAKGIKVRFEREEPKPRARIGEAD